MNKPNHHRLTLLLLPVLVLLVSVFLAPVLVGAENEPREQPEAESVLEEQAQASAEAESDSNKKPPEGGKTPPKPVKQFKPSEKIGADSAVSFPIDI